MHFYCDLYGLVLGIDALLKQLISLLSAFFLIFVCFLVYIYDLAVLPNCCHSYKLVVFPCIFMINLCFYNVIFQCVVHIF